MFSNSSTSSATTNSISFDGCKAHNICCLLTRRLQGFYTKDAGIVYRKNMRILRKLVCQDTTIFKNVWTTHSTSPIAYQSGKIYFDNYRCCVSSTTPEPRLIYQMPTCPKSEKIEDALLLECPVGEVLPNPSDYTPSLAVLTAHNWLFRLSANTGEILEKVYLASHCKFRYLSWDTPQEIMVVKSAQHKIPAASRQAGIQQSVLFFLAVFRVLPLSLIGMLEIDKKIFGNSMRDAAVSHRMLIVMHSTGLVRLYDFESICEQFMEQQMDLGQECNWNGKIGVVGKYPFGIPCNIKITETPDLLFEVASLENTFQVGGFPWHYIITPNKKSQRGIFHVCSLKDHTLAKNGIQDMQCCSLEPDWISFHPDSSGRMLHVGPNLIKVLKLKETENNAEQLEVAKDFVIEANRENNINNTTTVTASGRVVKKRFKLLDDDPEQEMLGNINLFPKTVVTEATFQSNYGIFYTDVVTVPPMGNLREMHRAIQRTRAEVTQPQIIPIPLLLETISSLVSMEMNEYCLAENMTFKIVDYEDELNLLSVVTVTQIGADGTAYLHLCCNDRGTQLKSIPFVESWDVTYSHEVYVDRNIVLHIEQKPNRVFSCYVYQMICNGSNEDENFKKKRGQQLCKTYEYFQNRFIFSD